jgi:hypothetical protein
MSQNVIYESIISQIVIFDSIISRIVIFESILKVFFQVTFSKMFENDFSQSIISSQNVISQYVTLQNDTPKSIISQNDILRHFFKV